MSFTPDLQVYRRTTKSASGRIRWVQIKSSAATPYPRKTGCPNLVISSTALCNRTAYNFRNIFCWACRTSIQMNANNPSCSVKEGFKANPGYLTALLNYKSEPETTALHEVKRLVGERNCDCAMMYDPYLVITLLHNAKTPLQYTIILIAVK